MVDKYMCVTWKQLKIWHKNIFDALFKKKSAYYSTLFFCSLLGWLEYALSMIEFSIFCFYVHCHQSSFCLFVCFLVLLFLMSSLRLYICFILIWEFVLCISFSRSSFLHANLCWVFLIGYLDGHFGYNKFHVHLFICMHLFYVWKKNDAGCVLLRLHGNCIFSVVVAIQCGCMLLLWCCCCWNWCWWWWWWLL